MKNEVTKFKHILKSTRLSDEKSYSVVVYSGKSKLKTHYQTMSKNDSNTSGVKMQLIINTFENVHTINLF